MIWPFNTAWPFKYVNGVQTPESVLLETNPITYVPTIPDIEEALL